MSTRYYRRGRNWHTAIGVLFLVCAGIALIRQIAIWGIEFVADFTVSADLNSEKVSIGMIIFGVAMICWGLRKVEPTP